MLSRPIYQGRYYLKAVFGNPNTELDDLKRLAILINNSITDYMNKDDLLQVALNNYNSETNNFPYYINEYNNAYAFMNLNNLLYSLKKSNKSHK